MRRWGERVAALAIVTLLSWPLILVAALRPWLLGYLVVGFAALAVGGWVGHAIGRHKTAEELHELTHEWRQLFLELGIDHGKELQEQYDAGFMAAMNAKEPMP